MRFVDSTLQVSRHVRKILELNDKFMNLHPNLSISGLVKTSLCDSEYKAQLLPASSAAQELTQDSDHSDKRLCVTT